MSDFLASIILSSSVWYACAENKVLTLIYGYIWKMTSDKKPSCLALFRCNLTSTCHSRTARRLLAGLTKCTQTQVARDGSILTSGDNGTLSLPPYSSLGLQSVVVWCLPWSAVYTEPDGGGGKHGLGICEICICEICGETELEKSCHRTYIVVGAFLFQWSHHLMYSINIGKSYVFIGQHFFAVIIINLNNSFYSQKYPSSDDKLYGNILCGFHQ